MFLTILACASLASPPSAAPGGTIVLRADAQVSGPTVELGEIADVRADSLAETQRIASTSLGATPLPGSLRSVTREEIARALRAAGVELPIGGATACRARPRSDVVSGRGFESAARHALAALFSGRDAEIGVARPASDLASVAAETKRELAADFGGL